MAYNPFHAFRKHQKALFAGLTILCMITFVMASGISGAGDAFSELQRLIGGKGRYPAVGTLYGKTIDVRDTRTLREQRRVADMYMRLAIHTAQSKIEKEIEGWMRRSDELTKS